MTPPDRIRVLGLPVDPVDREGAAARVAEAIAERRSEPSAPSPPFRVVVTNAHKTWLAHRRPEVRRALEEADLVVPEWATVWAARRLGRDSLEFVGGITLLRRLLREAAARGWSVYLLGARPGVVDRLAERLSRAHPGLEIAGRHHGYLDEAAEAGVRAEIRSLRPDLLFVGMGSPLQERWIFRDRGAEGAAVAMGVGGSFDVLAGERRDAPDWVRGSGFEWLWRMAHEPWRLGRRYAVVKSWFVWRVLRQRIGGLWGDGQRSRGR